MTKSSIGWTIYLIIILTCFVGFLGYNMYWEAIIFPPKAPENLEELANWEEDDIWRLMKYYNCRSRPRIDDVPDDLREFVAFCNTVSDHWSKKYRESKYDDAREGAKKLRQNNTE